MDCQQFPDQLDVNKKIMTIAQLIRNVGKNDTVKLLNKQQDLE